MSNESRELILKLFNQLDKDLRENPDWSVPGIIKMYLASAYDTGFEHGVKSVKKDDK